MKHLLMPLFSVGIYDSNFAETLSMYGFTILSLLELHNRLSYPVSVVCIVDDVSIKIL